MTEVLSDDVLIYLLTFVEPRQLGNVFVASKRLHQLAFESITKIYLYPLKTAQDVIDTLQLLSTRAENLKIIFLKTYGDILSILPHIPLTIRELWFRGDDSITGSERKLSFERFTELQKLSFCGCSKLRKIPPLPDTLEELDLEPQGLGGPRLQSLAGLPKTLKKLLLTGQGEYITDTELQNLPPTLEYLDISGYFSNNMKYTIKGIKHLESLKSLQHLNISSCAKIKTRELFSSKIHMPSVQILEYSSPNDDGKGSANVKQSFPNLTRLDFSNKDSLQQDIVSTLPASLQVLDLSNTDFTVEVLKEMPVTVKCVLTKHSVTMLRHKVRIPFPDDFDTVAEHTLCELCWTFEIDMRNKTRNVLIAELAKKHEEFNEMKEKALRNARGFSKADDLKLPADRYSFNSTPSSSSLSLRGIRISDRFIVYTNNYHTRLTFNFDREFPGVVIEIPADVMAQVNKDVEPPPKKQPRFELLSFTTFNSERNQRIIITGGRFTNVQSQLLQDSIVYMTDVKFQCQKRDPEDGWLTGWYDCEDFTNGAIYDGVAQFSTESLVDGSISSFLAFCDGVQEAFDPSYKKSKRSAQDDDMEHF